MFVFVIGALKGKGGGGITGTKPWAWMPFWLRALWLLECIEQARGLSREAGVEEKDES